jgi:hypothetical protein
VKRALLPLLSLVLSGMACMACTALPAALRPETGTEYTVVAPLLAAPGRPISACYSTLDTYPPLCEGVEVRNVDVATVAALGGDHPFPGGMRMSRSVRLVGTWNGRALTLTKRPAPANYSPASPPPSPMVPVPPPSGETAALAEARRITGDSSLKREGAQVLEAGIGSHGEDVDVMLVMADARAMQALHRHYASVHVTGWLQPVSRPSGDR